ncbi:ras-associated and pleckstrin homology domains-containing protein 1-like isoform X3 [Dreissena polymorpha]|uniref:ras-associated and pleckstrin homology domains-containing protein 1-like isoform X3 n=1 Tax=Dreissena polymorpha TaxID=45954 RepID=UPI0022648DCC|nr:ras-associated and pleckstrin homology domains-containing protein 1-like isoform X3 [Dreissena polymorpha]
MEYEDDYRGGGGDIEPDSDLDDTESESQLSQWLGELENYAKGLEPGDTGTVRRRQKTEVTPKMAMESFRYSFMSENQEMNYDAILGELFELETQLGTVHSELPYYNNGAKTRLSAPKNDLRDSGNDLATAELDALASEISNSLGNKHKRPMGELEYFRTHYPGDLGGYSDAMLDIAETDSAFSESASLPSSESFTSMVTVSSAVEPPAFMDGMYHNSPLTMQAFQCDEEQKAKLKAEKIRIALEKIKEAKIKKLFVRAFACDGSSKSIMVDEKMSILEVIATLADKNHVRLDLDLAVVEHMPELFMERVLEDHDTLVENMVMWTRDTKNQILFETRPLKNDLFKSPERYLLVASSSEKGASMDPKRRENLIQDFFSCGGSRVPEVEGVLYLKSDGKKAWKKYFFVLRASGLYYNPKGKITKSAKDLTCLVQFEFVELYTGIHWKKKYHAPTDFGFALKHPQIQKKTSKFIRYLCAENKPALDQWIMGIRIAKYGKQLLTNYHNLQREILSWDTHDHHINQSDSSDEIVELNQQGALSDSRMSVPEPGLRHSIVNVKTSMLVKETTASVHCVDKPSEGIDNAESDKMDRLLERKLSLTAAQISEPVRIDKPPVKRVSFSNTHSVIHDPGDEVVHCVRHRDSITSASTDSSEDSTSSGEGRYGGLVHRGSKLRAKLPVTTGTTKQISEMVQTSLDGGSVSSMDSSNDEWRPNSLGAMKDISERRKSAPVCEVNERNDYHMKEGRSMSHQMQSSPLSPAVPSSNSYSHTKNGRVLTSPPPRKSGLGNGVNTHSRGSSISSVESGDSGQGTLTSPLSEMFFSEQNSWMSYDSKLYSDCHVSNKQGPPTAQKPASIKKGRPHSGPAIGPVEKGHIRNPSKSSLESVEEANEGYRGVVPVSSPLPPRVIPSPYSVASHMGHTRSMSQPNTPSVSAQPPHFPSHAYPAHIGSPSVSLPSTPPATSVYPVNYPSTPPIHSSTAPSYPTQSSHPNHTQHFTYGHPLGSAQYTAPAMSSSTPCYPMQSPLIHQSLTATNYPVLPLPLQHSSSTPSYPVQSPSIHHSSSAPSYPAEKAPFPHQSTTANYQTGQDLPIDNTSTKGKIHSPASQPPSSPLPTIGCLSPRLSAHRSSVAKPVPPPMVPCTPPVLLPPTPRNPSATVSMHKKRPSGSNFVVPGNNAGSSDPDISSDNFHQNNGDRIACLNGEESNQGMPLPFMAELNKHMHNIQQDHHSEKCEQSDIAALRQPPQTLPKPSSDQRVNGSMNSCLKDQKDQPLCYSQEPVHDIDRHSRASTSSETSQMSSLSTQQQSKRQLPPPPPKRSETTKLSSSSSSADTTHAVVSGSSVPNELDLDNIDPIYDNCDGILDINELPPPPPEFFENFEGQGQEFQGHCESQRSGKVRPPPPPPPKRSQETQLSLS